MKKKISLLLLTIICVFAIVGCSSSEVSPEQETQELSVISDTMIQSFAAMQEADLEIFLGYSDEDLDAIMANSQLPIEGKDFRTMITAWKGSIEECGMLVEYGEYSTTISSGDIIVETEAKFEERDASIEFMFDDHGNLESMTVSPEYTMGEILSKAGMNTLLGMGTVFVVLIFISFIISLFKFIPALEAKFNKKPELQEVVKDVKVVEPVVVTAQEDDSQLIAVIAAAIAAAEGTTTDGFVVRSIKRRKSNQWNG